MQQARQLRAGGGIMTIPRQKYGLGKLVKKAGRALKKVAKSPIGKAALLAGATYGLGALGSASGGNTSFMQALRSGGLKNFGLGNLGAGLKTLALGNKNILGGQGLFGTGGTFSGKRALLTGGLMATALPFLIGGGDDEEEEVVESFASTPGNITDIVAQARMRDPSLRFLPQNAYTQAGFFNAAEGGLADIPREGYMMGGPTEEVVESMDTQEVVSNPDPMAELNMLSIELFGKPLDQLNETERGQLQELISRRMQEQEQPRVMAESGGMMDFMSSANPMAQSYLMTDEDIVSMYKPGKERTYAAEGGIMDLGGKEKDYRTGGFVDLGAKERADDVPARLSKNEFVFTADAVRNAGGGDIDKGAEVMDRMMTNLEQGGQVSEESQGGNPAQEMFNTAQMLESRIA